MRKRKRNPFAREDWPIIIVAGGGLFLIYLTVSSVNNYINNLFKGPAPGQSLTDYFFGSD
jgi:hypothetical protein